MNNVMKHTNVLKMNPKKKTSLLLIAKKKKQGPNAYTKDLK